MIIEAEEDAKQPRTEDPRSTTNDASTSVPAVHAQPDVPPPYTPRDTDPLLPGGLARTKKRTRWARCWRAFSRNAPLLLVGAAAGVLVYVTMEASRRASSDRAQVECDGSRSWSWTESTEGPDTRFYADTIVVVPRHATELDIESSSYRNFNGTVNVHAPVGYDGDQIRIAIRASHRDKRTLEKMGVCRPLPNMDVGPAALLFRANVQENESWAEPIELDVDILLPNDFRRAGHPKLLRDFSASLDFVNFLVTNLSDVVYFERFDLASRNGDIFIEGLDAREVTLSTGHGRVEGSISSTFAMNVTNSDGPVSLDMNILRSRYDESLNLPSSVNISADGAINVSIAFHPASGSMPEHLDELPLHVFAHTSTHPIDLALKSAPLDSTMRVIATSTTGNISVEMPLEFEGDFWMVGKRYRALHIVDGPDPSGQQRERMITGYPTGKSAEGSVFWRDHGPHDMGSVRMHTNGSAGLSL